jgi:hypothetical protein
MRVKFHPQVSLVIPGLDKSLHVLASCEARNPVTQGPEEGSVANAKDLTVKVETTLITRLKIQSALTGQTIKALVAKILDETLPPLPQESEATA